MIDESVIVKLKEKYCHVHPLIFHRSVEHSKSAGDLFDILYDLPEKLPILWDDISHRWITAEDPTCAKDELQ